MPLSAVWAFVGTKPGNGRVFGHYFRCALHGCFVRWKHDLFRRPTCAAGDGGKLALQFWSWIAAMTHGITISSR